MLRVGTNGDRRMRYSVHYETNHRQWVVMDVGEADQVLGVHASKAEAYNHASTAQRRRHGYDSVAKQLEGIRNMMPRSLVIG